MSQNGGPEQLGRSQKLTHEVTAASLHPECTGARSRVALCFGGIVKPLADSQVSKMWLPLDLSPRTSQYMNVNMKSGEPPGLRLQLLP